MTRLQHDTAYLDEDGGPLFNNCRLLQGLPVHIQNLCRGHVGDRHLAAMIGNLWSLNVIDALLSKTPSACGLMP